MKSSTLPWTRNLLLFTAAVLAVLGIGSFLRIPANPGQTMLYSFYALAMLADAAILFFCAWQLKQKTRFAFFFSAAVLFLNILLTVFDQFGWVDFLFVLLNLVPLTLLILARKEFLQA